MEGENPEDPTRTEGAEEIRAPRVGWDWSAGWEKWARQTGQLGVPRTPGLPSATTMWNTPLARLVTLLKSKATGREFTAPTSTGDVRFTVDELEVELDPASLAMGRLNDATVEVRDVAWREITCSRATLSLRNLSLYGGSTPQLVAAPVALVAVLDAADLGRLVAAYRPQISVEITPEDAIMVRWRRHPDWGQVEVEVGADGTRVWIRPRRLVRGRRSLGVIRRLPPISFRLGLPAQRFSLHTVEASNGNLAVRGRIDELRVPLGEAGPDTFLRRWSPGRAPRPPG